MIVGMHVFGGYKTREIAQILAMNENTVRSRDVYKRQTQGRVIYDADADYGGWWFCCFPYVFVQENDVLPFFIHCDDVEYGCLLYTSRCV